MTKVSKNPGNYRRIEDIKDDLTLAKQDLRRLLRAAGDDACDEAARELSWTVLDLESELGEVRAARKAGKVRI